MKLKDTRFRCMDAWDRMQKAKMSWRWWYLWYQTNQPRSLMTQICLAVGCRGHHRCPESKILALPILLHREATGLKRGPSCGTRSAGELLANTSSTCAHYADGIPVTLSKSAVKLSETDPSSRRTPMDDSSDRCHPTPKSRKSCVCPCP